MSNETKPTPSPENLSIARGIVRRGVSPQDVQFDDLVQHIAAALQEKQDEIERLKLKNTELVRIAGNFEEGSEEDVDEFLKRVEDGIRLGEERKRKADAFDKALVILTAEHSVNDCERERCSTCLNIMVWDRKQIDERDPRKQLLADVKRLCAKEDHERAG